MNHIILSIQPQWLAKILNGEKTVEIRKSVPKLPCTVWLYCTKAKQELVYLGNKKYVLSQVNSNAFNKTNGQIVAKFVLEEADQFAVDRSGIIVDGNWFTATGFLKKVSISHEEMFTYAKGKPLWAWKISNLVILDKPLSLGDFNREAFALKPFDVKTLKEGEMIGYAKWLQMCKVSKAPQSWQYVIPKGE